MSFFKNLFKKKEPEPIEQEELDLGKITCEVKCKNGETYQYTFDGYYSGSEYFSFGAARDWYDMYDTAAEIFYAWKKGLYESGFLRINKDTFYPVSNIESITITKREEKKVMTNRKY